MLLSVLEQRTRGKRYVNGLLSNPRMVETYLRACTWTYDHTRHHAMASCRCGRAAVTTLTTHTSHSRLRWYKGSARWRCIWRALWGRVHSTALRSARRAVLTRWQWLISRII